MSALIPQSTERDAVWNTMAGKSHLYETAYVRTSCECVKILGVRAPGVFFCRHIDGTLKDYGCEELTHYCL